MGVVESIRGVLSGRPPTRRARIAKVAGRVKLALLAAGLVGLVAALIVLLVT